MPPRGRSQNEERNIYITSKYSKGTAFVLCLLGGIIGLHYFYVGRWGRGFFTMFTVNFLGIGWFIDMGTILRGRFKDQYGDYLK